jgi:hypothetical protein
LKKEVIQWDLKPKRYNVLTVAPNLPLPLRTRSSFNPRAILMSPSAVPHAGRQGRQSRVEVVGTAMGPRARCSLPNAHSAAKRPKCLLRLPLAGQSIVEIATTKSDRADNAGLTTGHRRAGDTRPVYVKACEIKQKEEHPYEDLCR